MRFPEFSGEWKKHTLGDVSEFSKERVNSQNLSSDNYVATENMLQDYQGIIETSSVPTNTNVIKFNKGNVLLSNIRPYLKKVWFADKSGGCSADVFVFKALSACIPDYLHYIIANDRFINFAMSGAKGVKMPRGDKEQIKTYEIGLPSIEEQKKIAKLLSLLDERIATQNKIIEDLKTLKSALYHLIFSTIDNEFTSLGKIASIVKGTQINGTELLDEGDYYVMNGGIQPSGYYDKYNVPANTISISEGGNSCGYVQYNTSPFWSGGHCYTIQRIDSSIITEFLYHYLKYKEPEIMKLRIGSGLPNIQKKDLECFTIVNIPLQEQKGIVELFNMFETKEINESKILSLLQKQKSYLLGEMFI